MLSCTGTRPCLLAACMALGFYWIGWSSVCHTEHVLLFSSFCFVSQQPQQGYASSSQASCEACPLSCLCRRRLAHEHQPAKQARQPGPCNFPQSETTRLNRGRVQAATQFILQLLACSGRQPDRAPPLPQGSPLTVHALLQVMHQLCVALGQALHMVSAHTDKTSCHFPLSHLPL